MSNSAANRKLNFKHNHHSIAQMTSLIHIADGPALMMRLKEPAK